MHKKLKSLLKLVIFAWIFISTVAYAIGPIETPEMNELEEFAIKLTPINIEYGDNKITIGKNNISVTREKLPVEGEGSTDIYSLSYYKDSKRVLIQYSDKTFYKKAIEKHKDDMFSTVRILTDPQNKELYVLYAQTMNDEYYKGSKRFCRCGNPNIEIYKLVKHKKLGFMQLELYKKAQSSFSFCPLDLFLETRLHLPERQIGCGEM